MPPNTQRGKELNTLLSLVESWKKTPNEEEILSMLDKILSYVEHNKVQVQRVDAIHGKLSELAANIDTRHALTLDEHKNTLTQANQEAISNVHATVAARLSKLKDGHTPTAKEILALMPAPIPGKNGSPDTADEIVQKLNSLVEALNPSVIKGFSKLEARIDENVSRKNDELRRMIASITPRSSNSTVFCDLSAQTNGTLKIFSVPKSKSAVLFSSDFPTVLMENNGFTINATRTQITMTTATAPSSGSQLLYQYTSVFN